MREILFRGKRKDTSEWVEGFLLSQKEKYYICSKPRMCLEGTSAVRGDFYGFEEWFKVIPETVGQYTGLKDKNGVKMFEGDIIHVTVEPPVSGKQVADKYIEYNNGVFILKEKGYLGVYLCNVLGWTILEVIGNIHDNPELLEVTSV